MMRLRPQQSVTIFPVSTVAASLLLCLQSGSREDRKRLHVNNAPLFIDRVGNVQGRASSLEDLQTKLS